MVKNKYNIDNRGIFSSFFPSLSVLIFQAKAEEELHETRGQIDSLLNELSSLNQPARGFGSTVVQDVIDAPFSQPEGAVVSHTEMLQVRISSPCALYLGLPTADIINSL